MGGSLGFSIIGGTDHSSIPFGAKEPGIFISHVSRSYLVIFIPCEHELNRARCIFIRNVIIINIHGQWIGLGSDWLCRISVEK